jgi:nicotinamidase-related amidase
VLVIDVQEKLIGKILQADRLVANIAFLMDVAKLLGVATTVTEQYPRGLGNTIATLRERAVDRPDKLAFSSCAVPGLVDSLKAAGQTRVVVTGIESHVCVLHTTLDLLTAGLQPLLVVDAVGSRYAVDHATALRRLEQAGAVPTTTETCAFEWMGGAEHPKFKDVSKLIQERMKAWPPA